MGVYLARQWATGQITHFRDLWEVFGMFGKFGMLEILRRERGRVPLRRIVAMMRTIEVFEMLDFWIYETLGIFDRDSEDRNECNECYSTNY